ncbi:OmpL47-type beta-barrel domain-containing protein [Bacillus sp. ISL-75]|uniref:OmpL47-type beta-barrel domain-containing protein n=1 Tax=Bacillus sp. ISL-75 TaxID=2819137 RepID=UPI001BE4EEF2|nr:Ig-like domain repeat protein [Bacillus sp. ISL-75]
MLLTKIEHYLIKITEDKNPKHHNQQLPYLDDLESKNFKPAPEFKEDFGENSKIFVFKNTPFMVFDWLFDFYNYPLPKNEIRGIRTSFNNFIRHNEIKNFNDFINCKKIRDSFYDSVYSKNIKKYTFINNNNISLCMMHAPVRVLSCQEKSATLLTGDLNLEKNDIFINFNEKYSYIKFKLKVFFIPHHGSRLNWNDKLVYYCKNTLSIATVASSSKYGHPDFEVISKIFLSKNDVVCITEEFDSYKYIVDQKAPVSALSTKPGSTKGKNDWGWYKSDVQVRLISTDSSGSGVANTEYRINSGTWNPYKGAFTLTTDGTYTIDYRSTDNAGNTELYKRKTIKLDKTAPTLNIILDKTSLPANQKMVPIAVKINRLDATSGIDSVVLKSITSNELLQPNNIIQKANYNKPITGLADSFELLADRLANGNERVYTITYTATDKAGNVATESVTVTVS